MLLFEKPGNYLNRFLLTHGYKKSIFSDAKNFQIKEVKKKLTDIGFCYRFFDWNWNWNFFGLTGSLDWF